MELTARLNTLEAKVSIYLVLLSSQTWPLLPRGGGSRTGPRIRGSKWIPQCCLSLGSRVEHRWLFVQANNALPPSHWEMSLPCFPLVRESGTHVAALGMSGTLLATLSHSQMALLSAAEPATSPAPNKHLLTKGPAHSDSIQLWGSPATHGSPGDEGVRGKQLWRERGCEATR